jgi:hypothetical protein
MRPDTRQRKHAMVTFPTCFLANLRDPKTVCECLPSDPQFAQHTWSISLC